MFSSYRLTGGALAVVTALGFSFVHFGHNGTCSTHYWANWDLFAMNPVPFGSASCGLAVHAGAEFQAGLWPELERIDIGVL